MNVLQFIDVDKSSSNGVFKGDLKMEEVSNLDKCAITYLLAMSIDDSFVDGQFDVGSESAVLLCILLSFLVYFGQSLTLCFLK
jgi:hypothetical protein